MEMLTFHVVSQAFGTVLVFSESPAVRKKTDFYKKSVFNVIHNRLLLDQIVSRD